MSISSSFEVPEIATTDAEQRGEAELVDVGALITYKHVKLAAELLGSFQQDPSVLIKGYRETQRKSQVVREVSDYDRVGEVPSTYEEGEWRNIQVTVFGPKAISRAVRTAKSLLKKQPELPYTVQIEAVI